MATAVTALLILPGGVALALVARRLLRIEQPFVLTAVLFVPALIWLALTGGLDRLKASKDGFEVVFRQAVAAPVSTFATDAETVTIGGGGMMVQRMLTEAELLQGELGATAATRGTKTGRVLLWFAFPSMQPDLIIPALRERAMTLVADADRQYLVFGPEVGRITCYVADDSLPHRLGGLIEALRALQAAPRDAWAAILKQDDTCRAPLVDKTSALAAIRAMAEGEQDSAIVVRADGSYLGIVYRDRLISTLFEKLAAGG
jgi:hypothetical protein